MIHSSNAHPIPAQPLLSLDRPRAITMWDFSWLERRWPGAGYEDWDRALDELAERGYDAVRIDAYPHLVAAGAEQEWELIPEWSTNDWGSPARCRIRVCPALEEFIAKCKDRGILVALSSWFRQDVANTRLHIPSPAKHAEIWVAVLDRLKSAGLLDAIYAVDLCNEWPCEVWAPFFQLRPDEPKEWASEKSLEWMAEACSILRGAYPGIPLTFSTVSDAEGKMTGSNPKGLDFLEPHVWMSLVSDFNQRIGYKFERFDLSGYERIVQHAEKLYRSAPEHWNEALVRAIEQQAAWSRRTGLPLVTTECWGIVDYKDWPLLDWAWVKELCALGVETSAATGRWAAISTSNFCGPQFVGMWRDVEWHQRLTKIIRSGANPPKSTK